MEEQEVDIGSERQSVVVWLFVAFVSAALAVCMCGVYAKADTKPGKVSKETGGYYLLSQATKGEHIFHDHCSVCHGHRLQGVSAPALSGKHFHQFLSYSKINAEQLYEFISTQMPYNDPGSLSKTQYFDVLAYILHFNKYPAGKQRLDEHTLSRIPLQ